MTPRPEAVGAVILAAGFGTRLAPLTDHTPKPLLEVGGQPVASHLLDRLRELDDIDAVVVVVNALHLDQWSRWADSQPAHPTVVLASNGVVSNESRPGAVADLASGVTALPDVGWVVVVAGDNLLDEDLQPHLDAAQVTSNPVVLCRDLGAEVPPGRFGEITVNDNDVITQFREKPPDPMSPLAATCTYVLPCTIEGQINSYLVDGNPDSPGEFIGWLAGHTTVQARVLTGAYFDIGNHETLAAARAEYRVT